MPHGKSAKNGGIQSGESIGTGHHARHPETGTRARRRRRRIDVSGGRAPERL